MGTKLLAPNGTSQLAESFAYFDGQMRPRRTETLSADGSGREITDILYGNTGEVTDQRSAWLTGNPSAAFDGWNPDFSYERTKYGYNGLGEQTSVTPYAGANPLGSTWNTTTVTDGRTTTVTPPQGGTVTTTITNAQGNTAELRQAKPGGGTLNSIYTYDRLGQLKTVKDSAANTWTYTYDLLGRKTQTVDPDTGTSSATYTADGLTLSTTDGRGQQLWNEYDPLGRRINLHADTATGTVLSSWAYDTAVFTGTSTLVKGQLGSTTRFDGATQYKTTVAKYDNAYHPTETTTLAPGFGASGADLTYTSTATFNANGTPATAVAPAAADLQQETLTYTYNSAGLPASVTSKLGAGAATALIASTTYRYTGQVDTQILGVAGKQVKTVNTYETATRRQTGSTTSTETATPGTFAAQFAKSYGYDPAGNITRIGEDKPQTSPLNRYQQECFQYDTLRRLTQAWTQTAMGACTTPQRAGQATYWRTWTIDDIGNRQTQTAKNSDGTTATSWTYTNGSAGSVKPHQVKTITATGPESGTPTRTFGYDPAGGNMISRTTNTGATQTLAWDKENHLAAVTENSTTVASYIYNTDGSRLTGAATSGTVTTTTLYLPDGTELQKTSTGGSILGQRYLAGVAVRDTTGLKWTISNHQDTGIAQINAADLTYSLRRTLPYGEALTSPTWIGSKGYVGGTQDTPTGLTHLGAREYDPTIGRFISADPIMDLAEPQQWNPYSYSNNTPITTSDPSGLHNGPSEMAGGGCQGAECTPYVPTTQTITAPPTPVYQTPPCISCPTIGTTPVYQSPPCTICDRSIPVREEFTYDELSTDQQDQYFRCVAGGNQNCMAAASGGDKLSDYERQELRKKQAGQPYDQKAVKAAEKKIRNQEKYAGERNKQKRKSHYGANSEAVDISVNESEAITIGGVVVGGVAIVACFFLCILNPAMA